MSDIDRRIPLPLLARALRQRNYDRVPGYRRLYTETLNGVLPEITQDETGRYSAPESSLPAIAEKLGLVVVLAPRARGRSRNEPAEPIAA